MAITAIVRSSLVSHFAVSSSPATARRSSYALMRSMTRATASPQRSRFSSPHSLPQISIASSRRSMASTTTTSRPSTPPQSPAKVLDIHKVNPNVREAKYAVRGELAVKAESYRAQLAKAKSEGKDSGLPFDLVISANIGNPQQLDQKPITFFRQVLSILEYPELLKKESILRDGLGYKQDVIDRARRLLHEINSVGAYSHSKGVPEIRQTVAKFIEHRDGFEANPEHIFLTAGASSGVNTLMHIMCDSPDVGILIPIPQYPLYTATLAVLNANCVPYFLDESHSWATNIESIKEACFSARDQGIDVRSIVVINPGNPTGASLVKEDIDAVLTFAAEQNLIVIADEVYQTNVFTGEFISFKKQLRSLQQQDPVKFEHVELASLHSISKGMIGECGHRGGYLELVGFDEAVLEQVYKFVSIMLCPPVSGQAVIDMMCDPPKEGEPSYELYKEEYGFIEKGLRERAFALFTAFKEMEGVECQEPQGSMYLYPTIHLPKGAIRAARSASRTPDEFYCLALLDATGICVVPGEGFGQAEGTLHFRTTFLAPGTEWVGRWVEFHKGFLEQYAS